MKVSARLLLPLLGAGVLAVAVLGGVLWPTPSTPPQSQEPGSSSTPGSGVSGTPAPRAPTSAPRPPSSPASPEPSAPAPAPAAESPGKATVVPTGPEDELPLPESPNPLPQVNDPIKPEKPQTARWRLGKTERITEVLSRDVERLERERDAAGARGDEAERQRLDTLLERHRDRLNRLREEIQQLSNQAASEPPEQ